MKVWLGWLRNQLGDAGRDLDGKQAAELLTRAGLEVEGRSTRGDFSGVIVAEVRGKKPHPDASKLTLVDVWDGVTVTQVVCGAPNVPEPGHKVLWARPGAKVPMGEGGAHVTLAAKAVRGIESPGMLCAEDELGLGTSHAGILVLPPDDFLQPGDDVAQKLEFPDELLELNVTPNRSDCLGHAGVARELAALLGVRHVQGALNAVPESGDVKVALDADGCSRYAALVVEGVTVKDSPLGLRLRLAGLDVRSISNVVDITNALLMQFGQPTHAFDLDKLPGARVGVRRARAGEKIVTLDDVKRALEPGDLLIVDANDRPIALAGVMGGKETEVGASTKRVLLEIASFDGPSIRRTAKRLGLQSEASHRFERGVDPNGVARVAQAGLAMLGSLAGGRGAGYHDEYPRAIDPARLTLRAARTRQLTGLELDVGQQADRLRSLDLDVTIDGDDLHVIVPTFRPDLTREVDLIEEVLRLEGYDRVPLTIPALRSAPPELKHRLADRARDLFTALGFDEAITYAFVAPRELDALQMPAPRDRSLRIANPLREEQSAMRTSLLPGLVRAAARNVAHGVPNVRLFEVGHTFVPRGPEQTATLPEEHNHVAAIWVGARDGWMKGGEPADYFDLRGVVDELARGVQLVLDVAPSAVPWLHPGVQGALLAGDAIIGHLGELHPHVARSLELHERALVVELSLSALPRTTQPALRTIPRFPAVTRDASFLIDADRSSAEIGCAITALPIPLLVEAAPLEDYRDPQHVPAGKKSMLWSFTYRAADRTLTDAEVKKAHEELVAALGSLGGALR